MMNDYPFNNLEYLTALMSQVTGNSQENTAHALLEEAENFPFRVSNACASQGLRPYVFSDDMIRFYESTDAFMYELVCWNFSSQKHFLCYWIQKFLEKRHFTGKKTLIVGDGLGIDSWFFARKCGLDVTSYEISRVGLSFSRRLSDDFEFPVTLASSLSSLPDASYDILLSLDVLEHVPQPQDAAREYTRLLRPGGLFFMSAPFFLIHPRWPTHLRENRKFWLNGGLLTRGTPLSLVGESLTRMPKAFQKAGGTRVRRDVSAFFPHRIASFYCSLFLQMCPGICVPVVRKDRGIRELQKNLTNFTKKFH